MLYKMLAAVLLLAFTAALVTSKETPCRTGAQQCQPSDSHTVFNGQYYCCSNGFILELATNEGNGNELVSTCVCYREDDEIDCLAGKEVCENAISAMSDGNKIKCCKNGYSMDRIRNSFINGVRVVYCKCTRLNNNNRSFTRPMTKAEREHFDKSMKQFRHQMQTSMHNLRETLAKNLGSLTEKLGFLQGLTDGLNTIG